MFSMSSQDTRRKVRLNEKVESRVRGDLYTRFGGECLETYRDKTRQGAGCLAYGDTTRSWHAYTSFRRPFALGSSRSIIAQRHPYSTCPPGCIAPATRLGVVYRCRHTCLVGRTRPYCVYTLGRIRTQQSSIDRPYKAPYTRVGSSLTAVCQSWWMVWQPPFLALQPMACRTW